MVQNYGLGTHVLCWDTTNFTNRVPMAPFGLKLGQNESYGLQEPFKTLPALREPVFGPKSKKNVKKGKGKGSKGSKGS